MCAVAEQPNMSALLKEMAEQRQILDKLLLRDKPAQRRPRNPGAPRDYSSFVSYGCHELGHIKRKCSKQTAKDDLNKSGAGQGATARNQEGDGPGRTSK